MVGEAGADRPRRDSWRGGMGLSAVRRRRADPRALGEIVDVAGAGGVEVPSAAKAVVSWLTRAEVAGAGASRSGLSELVLGTMAAGYLSARLAGPAPPSQGPESEPSALLERVLRADPDRVMAEAGPGVRRRRRDVTSAGVRLSGSGLGAREAERLAFRSFTLGVVVAHCERPPVTTGDGR